MTATEAQYVGQMPQWMDDLSDCFPQKGLIHAYCWYAVQKTDAPPRFHIGSILPILSHELMRRGIGCALPYETVTPTWWTCLVGPSGVAKSTALRMARDFGEKYWETQTTELKSPFLHFDGSIPGILNALSSDYQNRERSTTEAILWREEFSKVLDSEGAAETLCELIDGQDIIRQTRYLQKQVMNGQGGNGAVRKPRCSGMFSTTPSALEKVVDHQHLEGGLFSRIRWITGVSNPEQLKPTRTNADAARTQALAVWGDWAATLDGLKASGVQMMMHLPAHVKQLAVDEMFEPFRKQFAEDLLINAARRRALEQVDVLACIYAISQCKMVVDEDDMAAAINFMERDIAGLFALTQRLVVEDVVRDAQRLLEALVAVGANRAMKKSHFLQRYRMSAAQVQKALEHLLEAELIQIVKRPHAGAGRPATWYSLTELGARTMSQDRSSVAPVDTYSDNVIPFPAGSSVGE